MMQTISTLVVYFTEPRLYISVVYSGSDVTSPEIAESKSTLRNLKMCTSNRTWFLYYYDILASKRLINIEKEAFHEANNYSAEKQLCKMVRLGL